MIEHYRRRPFIQATMLWDGTPDRADALKAWVGTAPNGTPGFLPAAEACAALHVDIPHALLWVAHSSQWIDLPVGHRVVAELDGSGHYPLSPEGLRAGFEDFPVACTCAGFQMMHPQAGRDPQCPLHSAPALPYPRRP